MDAAVVSRGGAVVGGYGVVEAGRIARGGGRGTGLGDAQVGVGVDRGRGFRSEERRVGREGGRGVAGDGGGVREERAAGDARPDRQGDGDHRVGEGRDGGGG